MSIDSKQLQLGDWRALRFDVVTIYEGAPGMAHQVGPGLTPLVQSWLIERGAVQVKTGLGVTKAAAGQWLFTTSRKQRHDFTDDAEILSIKLRAQWPDDRTLFRHDPPVVLNAEDHRHLERAARAILRMIPASPSEPWSLYTPSLPGDLKTYVRYRRRLQSLLEAYVAAMGRAGVPLEGPGGMDERVLEAVRFLDHLPWQATFDAASLGDRVGLSESQLHRLFVREVGITPFAYFDRRRLEYADRVLSTSDMPIKALAYALGFKHPTHFSNWFKRHHQASPRDYRKDHRSGKRADSSNSNR